MGRLENIIARHEERKKLTSRQVVIVGVFVLFIVSIILMEFTNLGMPKAPPAMAPPPKPDRVDGIYLGRPDSHRVNAPAGAHPQTAPSAPTH